MKTKIIISQLILLLLPLLYLLLKWKQLAEKLPMHFNTHNVPDRYGNKTELLFLVLFMSAVGFGLSMLLLNIKKIDPKQAERTDFNLMKKISWVIVVFMALLNLGIVYEISNYKTNNQNDLTQKFVLLLLALLFTTLGNFMENIKPNYFVGVRTPWTLNNENNWKLTHRLTAKLWFFGGILFFLTILILPIEIIAKLLLPFILLIAFIPIGYSFYIFKKDKAKIQ
jgi:uncharacterized membrane protein